MTSLPQNLHAHQTSLVREIILSSQRRLSCNFASAIYFYWRCRACLAGRFACYPSTKVSALAILKLLGKLPKAFRLQMAAPGFLDTISPWSSRSATPKPPEKASSSGTSQSQQGGDHRVNHRHRLSIREYPDDCPPLNVRWYYAVDVQSPSPLFSKLC